MPQRNTTKANGAAPAAAPEDRLTPQQCTAVDLLASGHTITSAASQVGVDRSTASGWLNHSAPFQAALNQRRVEAWSAMVETLRSLVPEAVRVLQEELQGQGPGRLQAAVHLLKAVNIYGTVGPPTGPVTPEDAEQEQLRHAVAREQAQITADDIRLAQQRRESDRMMATLMSVNLTGLGPQP